MVSAIPARPFADDMIIRRPICIRHGSGRQKITACPKCNTNKYQSVTAIPVQGEMYKIKK